MNIIDYIIKDMTIIYNKSIAFYFKKIVQPIQKYLKTSKITMYII